MRRDMDLVRNILLEISKSDETIELDPFESNGKLYSYHIDILKEANLITYKDKYEDMIPMIYIDEPRLTWEGNDYLDNINNESNWNKTKEFITSKGLELGDVPFSIIKDLAEYLIKNKIGLS